MAIVSSLIVRNHDRGNGSLSIYEEHTDDLGNIHEVRYSCPLDFDITTALNNRAVTIERDLISSEKQEVRSLAESGIDPTFIQVKYINKKQKEKQIIRAMMRGKPINLLNAANVISLLTDARIESMFSLNKRKRIRKRQAFIISNDPVFVENNSQKEDI